MGHSVDGIFVVIDGCTFGGGDEFFGGGVDGFEDFAVALPFSVVVGTKVLLLDAKFLEEGVFGVGKISHHFKISYTKLRWEFEYKHIKIILGLQLGDQAGWAKKEVGLFQKSF